jgi:hypothetical protein
MNFWQKLSELENNVSPNFYDILYAKIKMVKIVRP